MIAAPALALRGVSKTFTLHLRGGVRLPVVTAVDLEVRFGECVVLSGPSGAGKSSLLKMIYGNYRCDAGSIRVRDGENMIDVARADPRSILDLRRRRLAYVSQFLRVIPRVPTLDVVAEPLVADGAAPEAARRAAGDLLAALRLPERLWPLPPSTFSGGEQQRVNIARGFASPRSIMLLDEPTASLDAANREGVLELIAARKRAGAAMLGIFHDDAVRDRVADRLVDVTRFTGPTAAAAA